MKLNIVIRSTKRIAPCAVTNLWLNIHETDLVLSQNLVNGLQTGAIQIIFVLPVLKKSAETETHH